MFLSGIVGKRVEAYARTHAGIPRAMKRYACRVAAGAPVHPSDGAGQSVHDRRRVRRWD